MSHPSIPTATYRLQFHAGFTFAQAQALLDYLDELGISHVYASPIFKAAPGSTHGYDVCDHNALNPELGTEQEFWSLSSKLRQQGIGLIVDFVPNHMGIGQPTNQYWMNVLEHGPASPYAKYFDIDWHPLKRELEGKVLLPILGDQYGRVLEKGELKLQFAEGVFTIHYYETVLPVDPGSIRPLLQRALELAVQRGGLPAEHQIEFESIITAVEHLPPSFVVFPEKVAERNREQTVIKRRLKTLAEESPTVVDAVNAAIAERQIVGDRVSYEALDELLLAQNYRLSYWRVAGEEINYRRFFDINSLAAIRMEFPEVYEAAHQLLFQLIQRGAVQGVRIDHVDGLYDPSCYLNSLQRSYAQCHGLPEDSTGLYLLVEKILGIGEHLRAEWPVHGTTGYEFAIAVAGVLVDGQAQKAFSETYRRFVEGAESYKTLVYESKLLVMRTAMASEINVLGHLLNRLSETNRWYRDFTLNALTTAVRETIACFPVYRTYIAPDGTHSDDDRRVVDRAIAAARRRNPAVERSVFVFLRDVMLPPANNQHPVDEEIRREFVMKFQQVSGPITAKGVEDTAFYNFNRLIALNEVGGEPGVFGESVETFHQQNATRRAEFPHCMLATSTHDTKRSEDVRARIAALSEIPEVWSKHVLRWQQANEQHKKHLEGDLAPSANEEYLLYQTLVGVWPFELMPSAPAAVVKAYPKDELVARVQTYMEKALHEAKVNSSWIEPNQAWDQAAKDFVAAILQKGKGNRFLRSFLPVAETIAQLGAVNSLTQAVLKMTVPGVPDLYQGNEMWDFSLVDPDNRRPVDYDLRRRMVEEMGDLPAVEELLEQWTDGRIKLYITREVLRFRRENAALFQEGDYQPVQASGEFAESVIAFTRTVGERKLLVVVPRLSSRVGFWPLGEKWHDTALDADLSGSWKNIFTHENLSGSRFSVAEVLKEFPVAVLVQG